MKINYYLKFIVSFVIIVSLLSIFSDYDEIKLVILETNLVFLVIMIVVLIPNIFIRAYRWQYLYNNEHVNISIYDSLKLQLVGMSLNQFLPASSGDIAKSYYGYKWFGDKEKVLAISLIDKIVALLAAIMLGILGIYYYNYNINFNLSFLVYILIFITIITFIIIIVKNKVKKYLDFEKLLNESKIGKQKIIISILISIIGWLFTYTGLYLAFISTQISIDYVAVLLISPILTFMRLFPFTLNGMGTDEATIILIFSTMFNANTESLLIAALYYRAIFLIIPGLIGLIYMKDKINEKS